MIPTEAFERILYKKFKEHYQLDIDFEEYLGYLDYIINNSTFEYPLRSLDSFRTTLDEQLDLKIIESFNRYIDIPKLKLYLECCFYRGIAGYCSFYNKSKK